MKIKRMMKPPRISKRRLMMISGKMKRKRRRREEVGKEKARKEARERVEEEEVEEEEGEERVEAAELRLIRTTIQLLPITSKKPRRSQLLSRIPLRPKLRMCLLPLPRILLPNLPRIRPLSFKKRNQLMLRLKLLQK